MQGIFECFGLSAFFAGSMYAWPEERTLSYNREAPRNIRRRLLSIVSVCAAGLTYVVLAHKQKALGLLCERGLPSRWRLLRSTAEYLLLGRLGESSTEIRKDILAAIGATLTLFTGVIATHGVELFNEMGAPGAAVALTPGFVGKMLVGAAYNFGRELRSWGGMRNYVVCPLAEEWYFRGIPYLLLSAPKSTESAASGPRTSYFLLLTSASFAVAHLHHFRRYYTELRYRTTKTYTAKEAAKAAAKHSLQDALVTSTFGLFGGTLFLLFRRNALATAFSHGLCNYLGPPSLSYLKDRSISKRQRDLISLSYVVGIVAFFYAWVYRPP